ncbi:uncharacterized protein LOC117173211 isoform X1 [Belonocnema kinseyi]|uniref:uncharacterized protein LOC117173211 isoform X1 n=1 Tax=Belonocnema kinseyi TaxID=2817044 RepID=UPI00143DD2EE|nr:uncharacterized protein LOC117173211 isoform X1 [Belonocnema kinseyi]
MEIPEEGPSSLNPGEKNSTEEEVEELRTMRFRLRTTNVAIDRFLWHRLVPPPTPAKKPRMFFISHPPPREKFNTRAELPALAFLDNILFLSFVYIIGKFIILCVSI